MVTNGRYLQKLPIDTQAHKRRVYAHTVTSSTFSIYIDEKKKYEKGVKNV